MKIIYSLLFVIVFHVAFATTYYVKPLGSDSNNGLSIATAFQTIEKATYTVSPGDTVLVLGGIYTKNDPQSLIVYLTVSGTAQNPITFKAYPGETPILQLNANNWGGFGINGCDYIIIDGFTIIGNNDNITLQYAQSQQLNTSNPATSGNGISIDREFNNLTNKPHHITVRNCKISKCGGGGIYSYNADYTTIENNTVWECGWYAPFGNSGISLYQSWNSDSFTGFKNFITGNTCYRNQNYIPFFAVGSITDGNGIIIDDGRNTQNQSTLGVYSAKTYVANNLVFDNGGRGIHCYESDNVLVINNTAYKNCQSPSTREGELTAFDASNITFANNIVSPDINVPPIFKYNPTTSNISSVNNLITDNANLANPIGTNTVVGSASFINPSINFATANFHLQQNSLAINQGTLTNAPVTDKDGNLRLSNNLVDIGCYEYQNALNISAFNQNEISLFPNPSQGYFQVKLPNGNSFDSGQLAIIDLLGRTVKSKNISSSSDIMQTNGIAKGTYIVQLNTDDKKYASKMIIE